MNAEFRRNLWLELSMHRLIAMPAALGLLLALVYAMSDDPRDSVAATAAWIAAAFLGIWGARSAAEAVGEEMRARTWDAQRMSALGPWEMAWGKLFGAAAFAWYGGLVSLGVLLAAAPANWKHSGAKVAALIVAASILVQAAGALAGLAAARKGHSRGGIGLSILVLLVVIASPTVGFVASAESGAHWWHGTYDPVGFALASAACFAAWAVFGYYRAMCMELQVRTTPWAYAAFNVFLTVYLAGFWRASDPEVASGLNALLVCGLIVTLTLTYVQLFSEPTGVIVFRRIQVMFDRGELRRALEESPCWPVSFALAAVVSALIALLFDARLADGHPLHGLAFAAIPAFFLLARDTGIYLVFAFARQPRRVEAAALFYLVLLYGIVPGLLHAAEFREMADLVLPPIFTAPGKATVVSAVQALLAATLAAWRWRAARRAEAGA
jgi:hypothetical protein